MGQDNKIQLFEDKRIRTVWDEEKEEWFFSMVQSNERQICQCRPALPAGAGI